MYAVILAGGKQHRVSVGEVFKTDLLDVDEGASVDFDQVLMVAQDDAVKVGEPYLEGAKVSGEVVRHGRDKKIHIIKFKRRKHHMKQMGHRQYFTEVKITDIKD